MSTFIGKISRSFGWGIGPTKVLSLQWTDYATKDAAFIEGLCRVVSLPEDYADSEVPLLYEIVMHFEINDAVSAYSLMRTSTKDQAIEAAQMYNGCIPCLVESCGKDVFNSSALQKIVDILRERPSWNAAHLAVHFNYFDSFSHDAIINKLKSPDKDKGHYPLHVAVENESEKMIAALLKAGAILEVFDLDKNNPIHLAASKSVSIIQALKPAFHHCINMKNINGDTPLSLAAKASKLDNVKCLLIMGANVNHELSFPPNTTAFNDAMKTIKSSKDLSHKDLHKGGSLLHWVKTREMCKIALDLGCNPNLLNSSSQTPLHIMTDRNRTSCVLTLLSCRADPNIPDCNGNTPLHLAASNHKMLLAQGLIAFGAHLNMKNKEGETPRHMAAALVTEDKSRLSDQEKVIYMLHAVGAKRCKVKLASCSLGCIDGGSYNGVPIYDNPLSRARWVFDDFLSKAQINKAKENLIKDALNTNKKGRVLCLDGGGIKGLALCQQLYALEKHLGQPISESFDWISGTSTGGFLALMLASGHSPQHPQCMYYRLKEEVFVGSRPYDATPLEKILKKEFGENTVMSEITGAKVNVMTTLADRLPADLHIFRNYDAPIDILKISESSEFKKPLPPSQQKVWMAARASGAAPTFFRACDKYLDGGLIANNPVMDTLAEIEEWNIAVKEAGRDDEVFKPSVVVSLGCGNPPTTKVDNVDIAVESILDMRKDLLESFYNVLNIMISQACASEGRIVDRARAWCSSLNIPFFRFNPPFSQDYCINETSDEKLVRLMWESRAYMENQKPILDNLKLFLVVSELDPPRPPPRKYSGTSSPIRGIKNTHSPCSSRKQLIEPDESFLSPPHDSADHCFLSVSDSLSPDEEFISDLDSDSDAPTNRHVRTSSKGKVSPVYFYDSIPSSLLSKQTVSKNSPCSSSDLYDPSDSASAIRSPLENVDTVEVAEIPPKIFIGGSPKGSPKFSKCTKKLEL